MEILTTLKIIDISGVLFGVGWFLHWLFFKQREIIFFRGMSFSRVLTFLRELGLCFGTKAFGKASATMFFGGGFAFTGAEITGRLASRYAIVGGGSELALGGYLHEKAALITFGILITMLLAEIWWAVYKNRKLLEDTIAFAKLCLESYVVFGIVGLVTSFYL